MVVSKILRARMIVELLSGGFTRQIYLTVSVVLDALKLIWLEKLTAPRKSSYKIV
jgi:hypothetical protein